MAVDTPARIAVLGAGPIGLEAALYARFLGYDVDVYERGRVGEHIRQWGHVRLFSPFGMNASPLGIGALLAQDPGWRAPEASDVMTGREFLERYLFPLAASDLLEDQIHERTEVVGVAKTDALKGELFKREERGDEDFRLLLRDAAGKESFAEADVVIDATGVFGQSNALGPAGLMAMGERASTERIEHGLPDLLGADRGRFAEKHVVIVGGGYSAATNVINLVDLAKRHPATHVTWLTRTSGASEGPMQRIVEDRLPERDRVARVANELATTGAVKWTPESSVHCLQIAPENGHLLLKIGGSRETEIVADVLLANVGYQPDSSLYRELHVHECYATQGPIRLAAKLLEQAGADCLSPSSHGPETLFTSEPNFYILGAKSYGRQSQFLMLNGIRQIRDLFTIIGDRASLDLYKSVGGVTL